MRVRRLEIERFRGIAALDWRKIGDTAALVGPGDSGKSTILDALERVLSPRWNHPFDDTDFYGLETGEPIRIRATILDFPPSFLKDSKFGLALQAFDDEEGVAGVPTGADDETLCIVVELTVDSSLEPQWNVIDSKGDAHPIHVRDREALGMLRVGNNIDLHLGWNRGSVLTRVTETGDDVAAVLAEATRKARAGLDVDDLDRLKEAAEAVEKLGKGIGASIRTGLVPHLDVGSLAFNGGSLTLHDGRVPLRRSGLGTRRLVAIAMQQQAAGASGLTLIDEFEHGLEPHRIRQLLRKLRGVKPEEATASGQLLLTTHSPLVLSELNYTEIAVVRASPAGAVVVRSIPADMRRVLTKAPNALVARRVIVGEGETEAGLLRAVEGVWAEHGDNFAYLGTVIVPGEGDNAPVLAGNLHDLGFRVALFMDQDKTGAGLSRAKGAKLFLWKKGAATENVLAEDLTDEAFSRMVTLAHGGRNIDGSPGKCIGAAMAHIAGLKAHDVGADIDSWRDTIPDLRRTFGAAAKKKGWFKSLHFGAELGRIVADDLPNITGTHLAKTLEGLRAFAEHG